MWTAGGGDECGEVRWDKIDSYAQCLVCTLFFIYLYITKEDQKLKNCVVLSTVHHRQLASPKVRKKKCNAQNAP